MTDLARQSERALQNASDFLRSRDSRQPRLGLVLGSGLGPLADKLEDASSVLYGEIPGMPKPAVQGHSGRLTFGGLGGVTTACLEGRVHLYEGHPPEDVVFGVRLLAKLGCEVVLLTNAAGGTTPKHAPGALMLIADHINLTGRNPLVGWTHPAQFIDLSNAYDQALRAQASAAAIELGMALGEGVYAGVLGPSYETKAEVIHLSRIGADAVGMSTVLETIALRQLGVRVMAVSVITNAAAGVAGAVLDHQHVQLVAQKAAERMQCLILRWAERVFGVASTT